MCAVRDNNAARDCVRLTDPRSRFVSCRMAGDGIYACTHSVVYRPDNPINTELICSTLCTLCTMFLCFCVRFLRAFLFFAYSIIGYYQLSGD